MNKFILNNLFVLAIINLLFCSNLLAQSKSDILDEKSPINWLGIDFSDAHYIGERGGVGTIEMKEFFKKINELLLEETGRYNLKKTFHKESVIHKIEMVQQLNATLDTNNLITTKEHQINRISKTDVNSIVGKYETGDIRGTAAVIIMEDMNKKWETASMWVAYFNAQTKEVIQAVKLSGVAYGLGFRNHWASTIDDVLSQVQTKEYKKWQKLYGSKKK